MKAHAQMLLALKIVISDTHALTKEEVKLLTGEELGDEMFGGDGLVHYGDYVQTAREIVVDALIDGVVDED